MVGLLVEDQEAARLQQHRCTRPGVETTCTQLVSVTLVPVCVRAPIHNALLRDRLRRKRQLATCPLLQGGVEEWLTLRQSASEIDDCRAASGENAHAWVVNGPILVIMNACSLVIVVQKNVVWPFRPKNVSISVESIGHGLQPSGQGDG